MLVSVSLSLSPCISFFFLLTQARHISRYFCDLPVTTLDAASTTRVTHKVPVSFSTVHGAVDASDWLTLVTGLRSRSACSHMDSSTRDSCLEQIHTWDACATLKAAL